MYSRTIHLCVGDLQYVQQWTWDNLLYNVKPIVTESYLS